MGNICWLASQILYSTATDLKLGSSTYFFLLFSFLVLTKCQVLNLRVCRSRDQSYKGPIELGKDVALVSRLWRGSEAPPQNFSHVSDKNSLRSKENDHNAFHLQTGSKDILNGFLKDGFYGNSVLFEMSCHYRTELNEQNNGFCSFTLSSARQVLGIALTVLTRIKSLLTHIHVNIN